VIASCGRQADPAALAGRFVATDGGARWSFTGALTFGNAAAVLKDADALAPPASGVVDCSGVQHVDSAAVTVLLALKRRAADAGIELAFVNAPGPLRALADVYAVDDLLGMS
jgi:phospholipid transport system transporter-binding protein